MMPFIFHDFETQSDADLSVVGGLKYALDASTRALLLSWAIDDEPVKLWCPDLRAELVPEVWVAVKARMAHVGSCPPDVVAALQKPDGYLVAHNMAFDFGIWRQVAVPDNGFPDIAVEQTLDSMAQFQASNLPGQLEWAGRALGIGHKTVGGKAVMLRFANRSQPLPGSPADIDALMAKGQTRERAIAAALDMWDLYCTYAVQDTALMRDLWRVTRPLTAEEWQVYWASEKINQRGMMIDLDVCRGAVGYREEEALHVAAECARLTDGQITSPTLTKQINEWVYDRLPDDLAETMVKARDEEGYVTRLTGAKDVMARLLEDIKASDTPPADNVVDLLELLQFGRASSSIKYEKMLAQEVDGRIHGQFVFNGARHRFSSRGIQLHNLPRAFFDDELDILDLVAAKAPIEKLRAYGPVSQTLSKLLRPTVIAPEGRMLVWADYSAVEARVNPWLAGTRDAEQAVLEPFRAMDADKTKSVPDIYVLNAEPVFKIPADVIWERYKNKDDEAKAMRQAGKVLTLSLGFLGSVGALKAMARGYNIRLTDDEARLWVDGYRDRNRWVRRFGDKVEAAMFGAMRHPMTPFKAGRVEYLFVPDLMGGTLAAILPDGRPITYPRARIEKKEKFGKMQDTITYIDGMARMSMWTGLAIENCLAGDTRVLTRRGVVRLDMVQVSDLLWDGIEWVSHSKLLMKGVQPVIDKWGVRMTPNHMVLTNDGWKEAENCSGPDRAHVRLPDDAAAIGQDRRAREKIYLVGALRLRERVGSAYRWLQEQSETVAQQLRLQNSRIAFKGVPDARHVEAQSLCCLALDGGPLHAAHAPGMEELRWPWHHGMRAMAKIVSELLGRYGTDVSGRADHRPQEEQRGVQPRELPLGYPQDTVAEPAAQSGDRHTRRQDVGVRSGGVEWDRSDDPVVPTGQRLVDVGTVPPAVDAQSRELVYDLLNCGPRNRFTVFDENGVPFLVHNCTQFTAAGLLRESIVRIEAEETGGEIIGHTHDEILMEADEDKARAVAERLVHRMTTGFSWTEGLPLAAEPAMSFYYSKNEKATAL